ncbi:MAG TPA: hypothetical protein VFX61_02210 [Micromonosporaceae bacterium]|nr:hypothetical protein [Micromonosporaceae bacterium]
MPEFDNLDNMFAEFREGAPLVTPAGPGAARTVIRQRRRVQASAITGLAALVIAAPMVAYAAVAPEKNAPPPALSSPGLTRSPFPSPTVSPSASSSASTSPPSSPATEPSHIPAAAMLQVADLPSRFKPESKNSHSNSSFASTTIYCPAGGPTTVPPPVIDRRAREFVGGMDEPLAQTVTRYAPAAAAQVLAAVPVQVMHCDSGPNIEQSIVDRNFAGDESLLVYTKIGSTENLHIFVRQGGLVTEIWQKGLTDRDEARRLAQRAAQRLCAATHTC